MATFQLVEGYKYVYSVNESLSFTMDLARAFEAVQQNARSEERQRDSRNRIDLNVMSDRGWF